VDVMLGSSAGDGGAPDECEIVVRGKDAGSIRIGERYGCDRGRRPRAARSCSGGVSLLPAELRKQGALVAGGYGRDRGQRIVPPSAAGRRSVSFGTRS